MVVTMKCLIASLFLSLCDGKRYCCQDGWTIFNGSCYLFTKDQMSFNDAEKFCASRGSHLVAIESGPEQLFLQEYLRSTFIYEPWIGLTDEAREGEWIWDSTGNQLTFQNWFKGQPNDGPQANCVIIDTARESNFHWADRSCDGRHPPICEQR